MRFEYRLLLIVIFIFGPLDIAAWIMTFTIEPAAITPAVALLVMIYVVSMLALYTRLFGRKED